MPNVRKISIFQSHYENSLRYDLTEKLCLSNSHETPKIEKIILSASVHLNLNKYEELLLHQGVVI